MMKMSVKIFEGAPKVRLGELIELTNNVNSDGLYTIQNAMGMTITKEIIPTKANLSGSDLSKFLIVEKDEFVYNPRTHGKKIGLGYNNTDKPFIISWNNAAFKVKDRHRLLPFYLYLILTRDEWDREATFRSWGSSTEVFSWTEFCLMEIPLPTIEVQREYVATYKSLQQLAEQNEALIEPIKISCDAFIAKMISVYPQVNLGSVIKQRKEKNTSDEDLPAYGVSREGFIPPKQDITDTSKYKIFHKWDFVFNPARMEVNSIALNSTIERGLCSPLYEIFSIKEDVILPQFLNAFVKRAEFARYCSFISNGSAREICRISDISSLKIPLPPIEVQRSIVALYRCAEEARSIAKEAREQLKKLAPAMVQRAANTPIEV